MIRRVSIVLANISPYMWNYIKHIWNIIKKLRNIITSELVINANAHASVIHIDYM